MIFLLRRVTRSSLLSSSCLAVVLIFVDKCSRMLNDKKKNTFILSLIYTLRHTYKLTQETSATSNLKITITIWTHTINKGTWFSVSTRCRLILFCMGQRWSVFRHVWCSYASNGPASYFILWATLTFILFCSTNFNSKPTFHRGDAIDAQ